MNYDVIVIGSGLGGLTCAARLSVLGYKVGVFEQHYIPGGYATNFKRCGYNFDVSLHGIGGLEKGGNVHNILSACNVMNKITPLKNPIAYSIHYNGELLEIPNDLQKYKELLINRFPFEEKNINKLFKDLHRFSNGFDKFILKRNKKFLDISNLDILLFIKWSYKSTYNVIKGYVNDEEFIKIFSGLWTYYGLPPKKLSAIYYFIPWISYHIHGKCYIEGGAQALSNSFVKSIEENGGKVHLKCEVESILYDDNKVYGVKLKNDEQYKCNYVVSNANPISTYNMLPKNALTNKEVKK